MTLPRVTATAVHRKADGSGANATYSFAAAADIVIDGITTIVAYAYQQANSDLNGTLSVDLLPTSGAGVTTTHYNVTRRVAGYETAVFVLDVPRATPVAGLNLNTLGPALVITVSHAGDPPPTPPAASDLLTMIFLDPPDLIPAGVQFVVVRGNTSGSLQLVVLPKLGTVVPYTRRLTLLSSSVGAGQRIVPASGDLFNFDPNAGLTFTGDGKVVERIADVGSGTWWNITTGP